MNIIKKIFGFEKATGGIRDKRDIRDYHSKEIFKAPKVKWEEKSIWRSFPIFNQDSSDSCVAQTVAKLLGVENYLEEKKFIKFSARDIYSQGYLSNGGMYYRKGMKIGYKVGATLEQLMLSDNKNEGEMRKADDRTFSLTSIADMFKGGSYIAISLKIDDIANIISQGKAVAIGVRFDSGDFRHALIKTKYGGEYGHAITGVDFTLYKGKKAIIFDNSWGKDWGKKGQGILTEDNFDGVVSAWYYEDLSNKTEDGKTKKPNYEFTKKLVIGDREDAVAKLQEALKYEGCFPIDIPCTGYFGGITREAVKKFQYKYNVASEKELEEVDGMIVGPATRAKLNELF